MTEEEWKAFELDRAAAMMNVAPKPSLEARIDRLEREALERRTDILKLERDVRHHRVALWVLAPYLAALALAVLT